jgi:hypothetical protein
MMLSNLSTASLNMTARISVPATSIRSMASSFPLEDPL